MGLNVGIKVGEKGDRIYKVSKVKLRKRKWKAIKYKRLWSEKKENGNDSKTIKYNWWNINIFIFILTK